MLTVGGSGFLRLKLTRPDPESDDLNVEWPWELPCTKEMLNAETKHLRRFMPRFEFSAFFPFNCPPPQ